MSWYVIRTDRTGWKSASVTLRALGFPAYVPCEKLERTIRRKRETITRPVWPGYLFVCCEPTDFGTVLDVDGLEDFIRCDTRPVRVPDNALVPVLLAEVFGDLDFTRKPKAYVPLRGDRVMIKAGKFRGYLGRIIAVGKRKAKLEMDKGGRMEVEMEAMERAA
jgi:transcriptional antiterminator RfaH